MKTDLRQLSLAELEDLVTRLGLPAFRYRQIARWLYHRSADSIDEMTDLSLGLRAALSEQYEIRPLKVLTRNDSQVDGSSKWLFGLPAGGSVESVLMPKERRTTLCISSQIGCTLDCVFCQTAKMGFTRNLGAHEIVGQVLPLWREIRDQKLRTNIVFMGMGEPLHNADAVVEACRILTDPWGLNLGPGRITVSTAGALPGLRKLKQSGLNVKLAVSLNGSTQEQRERLMPKAARVPLPELLAAARDYVEGTRNRVTMEYVLMKGVNDTREDAERLGRMLHGGPFKLNIIPYNPGAQEELQRPSREDVDRFVQWAWPKAPVVTVRWSMGPDISAACGQLKTEVERRRREARAQKKAGTDAISSAPAHGESGSKPD